MQTTAYALTSTHLVTYAMLYSELSVQSGALKGAIFLEPSFLLTLLCFSVPTSFFFLLRFDTFTSRLAAEHVDATPVGVNLVPASGFRSFASHPPMCRPSCHQLPPSRGFKVDFSGFL